ncbi:MAG: GMC family oxidoreductase [Pseudomonadota bacterium]
MEFDFDAIVVGSGSTGGWAAKELTEKGLKTLMLDRGHMIEHSVDYDYEGTPAFEMPYRGNWPPGLQEKYYQQWAASPYTYRYWNNDSRFPYIDDPEKPFRWARSGAFGGKSIAWGRQTYRWSDLDFKANERDGHGIPWPIGYADIEPWYSYVERFMGIQGEARGLPQLPDSEFIGQVPLNFAEEHFKREVEGKLGRAITVGRTMNLMEDRPDQGRGRCQFRDQCWKGCSYGAAPSTQATTFPAAQKTGNLSIRTDATVSELIYDADTQRVTGVRVIDTNTKEETIYRARIVFLNASCLSTTQILLNSKSEAMPRGLGNSHDMVGRHVMDHMFGIGATGTLPGNTHLMEYGRRPASLYIPRFRNINPEPDEDADFIRGYNYQAWGGGRSGPQDYSGFGAGLKAQLRVPGSWRLPLHGFGEVLPNHSNRAYLDETQTDDLGMPLMRFDVEWGENEQKMATEIAREAARMLETAGFVDIEVRDEMGAPGIGIHEMGTARMGDDPTLSVVNKWNQMHIADNVFITDGAFMTSSGTVNPTMTYMAFTARAADHAVELFQSGQI